MHFKYQYPRMPTTTARTASKFRQPAIARQVLANPLVYGLCIRDDGTLVPNFEIEIGRLELCMCVSTIPFGISQGR